MSIFSIWCGFLVASIILWLDPFLFFCKVDFRFEFLQRSTHTYQHPLYGLTGKPLLQIHLYLGLWQSDWHSDLLLVQSITTFLHALMDCFLYLFIVSRFFVADFIDFLSMVSFSAHLFMCCIKERNEHYC